jgi:hypothetical protein
LGIGERVVTGEKRTGPIPLDRLTEEEEKNLHRRIDPSPKAQVEEEIRLLTIRERRMLAWIEDLLRCPDAMVAVESTTQTGRRTRSEVDVVTVRSESALERVRRLEETLTRVQQRKAQDIEILRSIQAAIGDEDREYLAALAAVRGSTGESL